MDVKVAILGGGITGLATAAWLELDHGVTNVAILEGAEGAGGKISTVVEDGLVLEGGPQGFLDNAPDTLELVERSGMSDDLVAADERSADRFILRAGKLRSVPTSPGAFLASDILPLLARLRVLGEPFGRRRPDRDETVFDFAARRIGRGAAEVLVDAMVTGVFAGDARSLSLAATFPRMAAMEAAHGSLTRALIAKMREARREGRRSGGPAGPGGTLTSFRTGMARLPEGLAARLGERLLTGRPVAALERDGNALRLATDAGPFRARTVVATTPATVTARLLGPLAPGVTAPLTAIPTVPIAVAMAAYDDPLAFGRTLGGFGFLVPSGEGLGILGTLFCHSIFAAHAPEGSLLLRTIVGGAREPAAAEESDEALVRRVRGALRQVFGRDPEPRRWWIVRWPEGISQYTVGHLRRVEAAEAAAGAIGVELAGSPYRGVSVNDCIRQARAAAARVAARLKADPTG